MIWFLVFLAISFVVGLVVLIALDRPSCTPLDQEGPTGLAPEVGLRQIGRGGYTVPRRLAGKPAPPHPVIPVAESLRTGEGSQAAPESHSGGHRPAVAAHTDFQGLSEIGVIDISILRSDKTVTVSDGIHTRETLCASAGAAKGLTAHLECDRELAGTWLREVGPMPANPPSNRAPEADEEIGLDIRRVVRS